MLARDIILISTISYILKTVKYLQLLWYTGRITPRSNNMIRINISLFYKKNNIHFLKILTLIFLIYTVQHFTPSLYTSASMLGTLQGPPFPKPAVSTSSNLPLIRITNCPLFPWQEG